MKEREYPTVSSHGEVRCPKCGRNLSRVGGSVHGNLASARWAKHCGAPCFGTAWYNVKEREAVDPYPYLSP